MRPISNGKGNGLGARLFVDNLPLGTTEEALHHLFSQAGRIVLKVSIMADRRTGDSHGYAFVEMASQADAARAIAALHDRNLRGHRLHVSAARPRMGSPPEHS
jgi:RNA recognition motif-containing protein